jgi:membrane associated rhomboid family serine protease
MVGQNINIRIGGPLTPVVKKLLIINGAIFITQQIAGLFYPGAMEQFFGLHHLGLTQEFKFWQILTYMFLHGGWFHILFNLLGLWMFAGELEQIWGRSLFLRYYMFCGIGAGLFIALMNYIMYARYQINPVTLGASGAIYGILLAYGWTWPNRQVLLYFVIPIKVKYLVVIFGLIEFFGTLSTATGTGGNISHIGHLGGLVSGLIFMIVRMRKTGTIQKDSSGMKDNIVSRIMKKRRLIKKKKEIETRIQAKKIIDELLEKIARQGMSSLTQKEKTDLEWARKHYYPDNDEIIH